MLHLERECNSLLHKGLWGALVARVGTAWMRRFHKQWQDFPWGCLDPGAASFLGPSPARCSRVWVGVSAFVEAMTDGSLQTPPW